MRSNVGVMKSKSKSKNTSSYNERFIEWKKTQKSVLQNKLKKLQFEEKQVKRKLKNYK